MMKYYNISLKSTLKISKDTPPKLGDSNKDQHGPCTHSHLILCADGTETQARGLL